ncbi:hypothetical protein [Pseudoponticoccus marisrubri]|uniref:Uncharacterized protein n=1 Tax=Pseudoponticoccus marisrubri TaxID=1685382 RepID=A0A0W7WFB2_9RHOB|nr:hypothetical protein [Pseudoponticoccus marisrubri]KUF09215.1 hypothetical protein AVJ23_18335 [Pseudoponticoccus marisrubri]
MTSLIALATILLTSVLVLSQLPGIARDTYDALAGCAARARADHRLPQRAAFLALWAMIFLLSYL